MAQTTQTTAAHTTEAAHGGGEFPPFNTATYPAQILWLALTFGFLYWMMQRTIAPRLAAILETRRSAIAADLEEAARQRDAAAVAGRAYEDSLASARAKAQAIAQETRATLTAESDARRKTIEADLAERLGRSDAAIRAKTADAMSNVRSIAADAAVAIVERLTGHAPAKDVVEAALDRASSRSIRS